MGLTTFVIQRLSQNQAYQIKSKCIYLAQAGLHQAIYFFRFHDIAANGYFTLGQTNIDTHNFFVLGGTAADMLMVNTSSAAFGGGGKDLGNLTMQNASDNATVTINRMIVSWVKTGTVRTLQQIRINNSNRWSGNLSSPADCDINDVSLDTTTADINRLRFSGDMSGTSSVIVQFVMTDGSTKTLTVYPAFQNYSFTVKSTGKTTNSNIYRTIEANYNALTGKITRYDEINTQITP